MSERMKALACFVWQRQRQRQRRRRRRRQQ